MENLNGIKRPSETNSSHLTALTWNISVLPPNQDTNMSTAGISVRDIFKYCNL